MCDGTNRDCPDPAIAPAGSECGPGCLCDGVSEGMPGIGNPVGQFRRTLCFCCIRQSAMN